MRMKPVLIAAAGAAVLAAAGACSASDWEYTPRSGTVTELEHEPAESYQDCQTRSVYNSTTGKYENKRTCEWVYEDECYEVDFKTPEGDVLEECTTKEIFEGLTIGAVYIEGMDALATHTPWLTPSPSPSLSPSETPSTGASASAASN